MIYELSVSPCHALTYSIRVSLTIIQPVKMSFSIQPVSQEDCHQIATFAQEAFGVQPLWPLLYPGGVPMITKQFETLVALEGSTCHKLVDDSTGQIASFAIWFVNEGDGYLTHPAGTGLNREPSAPWLEPGEHREYLEHIFRHGAARKKAMPEMHASHCYLAFLATNPTYYKRGCGSRLLAWGKAKAKEMGGACVLEASPVAHELRFYHHHGFQDVQRLDYTGAEEKRLFPNIETEVVQDLMCLPASAL
ncbi:hypothetical protein MRB53_036945 [Persea americana]|nr:hypothetical protein MRB53_036945 [Persea americana]